MVQDDRAVGVRKSDTRAQRMQRFRSGSERVVLKQRKECKGVEETGEPRENPPANGIVRHISPRARIGHDSAGNRTGDSRCGRSGADPATTRPLSTRHSSPVVDRWVLSSRRQRGHYRLSKLHREAGKGRNKLWPVEAVHNKVSTLWETEIMIAGPGFEPRSYRMRVLSLATAPPLSVPISRMVVCMQRASKVKVKQEASRYWMLVGWKPEEGASGKDIEYDAETTTPAPCNEIAPEDLRGREFRGFILQQPRSLCHLRGRGGVVVRLLSAHHGEQGSILGGVAAGFSHVGIMSDDAVGRQVFSGICSFPRPYIPALLYTHLASPASALKTLMLRAAQIYSFTGLLGP
ncbi:hypothetical protein PR048_021432 [Dryococelus australis]|uniref:Uncharacterized protein n=1 Tax=Dryococelus australis TaxID=614101 RepID=A0ABQ9GY86_9NEOP|nr:hypothetical protein PR048_021432 [Dryococelus australis]